MQPPHHNPGECKRGSSSISPPPQDRYHSTVAAVLPPLQRPVVTAETLLQPPDHRTALPVSTGNQVAAQCAQEQAPLNRPCPPPAHGGGAQRPGDLDTVVSPTTLVTQDRTPTLIPKPQIWVPGSSSTCGRKQTALLHHQLENKTNTSNGLAPDLFKLKCT